MARHDDRERISPEGLPHRAGQAADRRGASPPRRRTACCPRGWRGRPRRRDDRTRGTPSSRARTPSSSPRPLASSAAMASMSPLYVGRRRRLGRAGEPPPQASARLRVALLRKLGARDAALAPRDAAAADRGVEQREALHRRSRRHLIPHAISSDHRPVAVATRGSAPRAPGSAPPPRPRRARVRHRPQRTAHRARRARHRPCADETCRAPPPRRPSLTPARSATKRAFHAS